MDIKKLEKLIYKNARLFNMTLASKKVNPFIIREDYHLSTVVENDLFSWELQMTIGITTNGLIHMMMFMHPVIVEDNTCANFIEFANAAKKEGKWTVQKSIKYLDELREVGYIENSDYGLC